jgi:thiamine biosynthesis lipoprotein
MNTISCILLLACGPGILARQPEQEDPAPPATLTRFSFTEPHMGTRFKIIVYAETEPTARKAVQGAFGRIAALDAMMTDYRPDSELMQLCRKAGGPPVPVSKDLFFVLKTAQEVSQLSNGAFDVTVGPLVHLWRLARRSQQLPDAAELARARALVGYRNIRLDEKHRTVQLLKPGMKLDLGGIAKGYAADEALAVLKQAGLTRALVAAGGDIAVSGPPPDALGWKVGIAPLEDPDRASGRYLLLHDAAVSTSGDTEQYVEIDGKRYSHIVDPKTGMGLLGRQSVTITARHGIYADSLTKVVSVLGWQKGLPLIETLDGATGYVVRQTAQGQEIVQSKHFPPLLERGSSR